MSAACTGSDVTAACGEMVGFTGATAPSATSGWPLALHCTAIELPAVTFGVPPNGVTQVISAIVGGAAVGDAPAVATGNAVGGAVFGGGAVFTVPTTCTAPFALH